MAVILKEPPPSPPPPETVPPGWERILMPGEKVFWQGLPDTSLQFSLSHRPEMLFGLLFTGFSIFWMAMASLAPRPFWMFGLPFFFVGLSTIMRRNIIAALARRYSTYSLTSQRAINATNFPIIRRRMRSYRITTATKLEMEEDGAFGSIIFHRSESRNSKGRRIQTAIGFERITEAAHVLSLMRQIQYEGK
jgi:hypothetical protein